MQPKNEDRWIIRRKDSNPPEYFCTKGLRGGHGDVEIHRVRGVWRNKRSTARCYTHTEYQLPEDCEFEKR